MTLSQKELQRIRVVENAVAGTVTVAEAAALLGKSDGGENAEWVHHGNSGRRPANAIGEEKRQKVVELAGGKYAGFNDSHLQEKVTAVEGMVISRQSVRQSCVRRGSLHRRNDVRRNTGRGESVGRGRE